jgi:hypothetical protein
MKLITLGVIVWLAALGIGFGWLAAYKATPGEVACTDTQWPADSALRLDRQKLTLVMFLHPRCPCSRASLEELRSIINSTKDTLSVQVVFYQPDDDDSWRTTDICTCARQLSGVRVSCDLDGGEARRFGATTSGHTFVYSPDGRLHFCGGITASRGHVGANAGSDAILALCKNQGATECTSVFGCALFSPSESSTQNSIP